MVNIFTLIMSNSDLAYTFDHIHLFACCRFYVTVFFWGVIFATSCNSLLTPAFEFPYYHFYCSFIIQNYIHNAVLLYFHIDFALSLSGRGDIVIFQYLPSI